MLFLLQSGLQLIQFTIQHLKVAAKLLFVLLGSLQLLLALASPPFTLRQRPLQLMNRVQCILVLPRALHVALLFQANLAHQLGKVKRRGENLMIYQAQKQQQKGVAG